MKKTTYYAVVTFGSPTFGHVRSHYKNIERARKDARTLGGGSMTNVRIVEAPTKKRAMTADISDADLVVVEHV